MQEQPGARASAIHENILANVGDGVVSIDLGGRITTFNPAAAAILGLAMDQAVGRLYAELFFEDSRFDPLNELVLKAIYQAEVTHSEEVELRDDANLRNLVVSTTFLTVAGERLGVIVLLRDVTEQRKRRKIKRLFGKVVDPRIVERILSDARGLDAGIRQRMTVSFVDLEGFTRLGEAMPAADLLSFLNGYLAAMSAAVAETGGVTDKYIGDSVMAFWGPPFTDAVDHAERAVAAALDQRRRLADLRAMPTGSSRSAAWPADIETRSGIATGDLVVGSVGNAQSQNYTVIGDPVNLAARLEQANKPLGTRILVCARTAELAGKAFAFREVERVAVRGRQQADTVFEPIGPADRLDAPAARLRDGYEAALRAYRARDWQGARRALDACFALAPGDGPSRRLAERVERMAATAPEEGWDGVLSL